MGKVLSTFTHGWPGTIARNQDAVVVALANRSGGAIPFGSPVCLDHDRTGVIPFNPSTHTGADFVGIAVRTPSKSPDTYGDSEASYARDDLCDILVRGHIIARIEDGDADLGVAVAIEKSSGGFAIGTGNDYIPLPNVRVSAPASGALAELVLTERNIV